jgi:hypothetical protein
LDDSFLEIDKLKSLLLRPKQTEISNSSFISGGRIGNYGALIRGKMITL